MDHEYVRHASAPGRRITVHVENQRGGERVFDATLSLERRHRGTCRGCGDAIRPSRCVCWR